MCSTSAKRQVHGFEVEDLESVSSTQELLKQRLAGGQAVAGLVVRAGEQRLGRGRRGTPWASLRGGSYQSLALSASALLTPVANGGSAQHVDGRLTLALGLGIARSLTGALDGAGNGTVNGDGGGGRVLLKWPNDLILDDKKLGGIIVEIVAGTVIAGIGINVENQIPAGAAALRGRDVAVVGDLVLAGVRAGLELLLEPHERFVQSYAELDWLRGRQITVTNAVLAPSAGPAASITSGQELIGVADGIDVDGRLLLEQTAGRLARVVSGHVSAV